jgi:hypothetical protein
VDPLTATLEHGRDRILGQPVDLEIRVQPAQLIGDRQVSPDVAESDRRGHIERSPAARLGSGPAGSRPRRGRIDELPQRQVEPNRVTQVGGMATSFELE